MMQPAPIHQPTLYEALEALPEGVTGEILNGQLHTQPRPSGPHGYVSLKLTPKLDGPYGEGIGGPGGWWIFPEIAACRTLRLLSAVGWVEARQ